MHILNDQECNAYQSNSSSNATNGFRGDMSHAVHAYHERSIYSTAYAACIYHHVFDHTLSYSEYQDLMIQDALDVFYFSMGILVSVSNNIITLFHPDVTA